jgi:PAS domain S-box-containing protein
MTGAEGTLLSLAAAVLLVATVFLLRREAGQGSRRMTAAEKTHRAFFDHAIEGIFRTTPEGRYVDANPALARIYGYDSPQDLVEGLTDIAGQLYVAPGRREAFRDLLQAHDVVTDFVSEIRRRDGTTIWISENARAVRNWTGQLVFYEGTVEDVTGKVGAENALRQALREAERANEMKSAFLAAMSHELKTPLNAVLGFAEMLKAEILGPLGRDAYRDYAEHIHASGLRLLEIINNVLDITRLQAAAMTLERHAVDFEGVARAATEEAKAAVQAGAPVTIEIAPGLPLIDADPRRLGQVLRHLLSNALKFTPPDGSIALRARPIGDGVIIEVADTGIGMDPDKIAMALEPFRQLDSSLARRFEGTGLGLALSNAFVALHGGSLAIESREGEGTTVTVRLAAAEAMQKAAAA